MRMCCENAPVIAANNRGKLSEISAEIKPDKKQSIN